MVTMVTIGTPGAGKNLAFLHKFLKTVTFSFENYWMKQYLIEHTVDKGITEDT